MIRRLWIRLWREEQGATAVEYAALLALIFLAVIAGVTAVGERTGAMFQNATDQFEAHGM